MLTAPDDVLLAGLAGGDREMARAFVERFSPRAIGLAAQLVGDRKVAEDIAQEAMLRAWRHAGSYDPRKGTVSTWLLSIVRHLAIDTLRLRRAEPFDPASFPMINLASELDAPERVAEHRDDATSLRRALAALPIEQRRALLLAYGGRSASEVAAVESIPLGTAKTRIRTGLQRVRAAYLADPSNDRAEP